MEVEHFFPNFLHRKWGLRNFTNNNELENLFLSCRSCNLKKNRKHPEVFLGGNFIAWTKWQRANFRVGLVETKIYSL